jgi:hypothetical protein
MLTTGDPARNPTFAYFANDTYFVSDFGLPCSGCIESEFAWNHGDAQAVIGHTWQSYVGPGVKNEANGGDAIVFTDHTDVRPTINSILGLHDPYVADGRVITQALLPSAFSTALASNQATIESLGDNYKQINAPFGPFPQCILSVSTIALQGNDTNDATYTTLEASITSLTSQRDALATSIKTALDGAEFGGTPIDPTQASTWITQAQNLIVNCNSLLSPLPPVADAGQ